MAGILCLLILGIFILIWVRPAIKRQETLGGYASKKMKVKAVLFGLIPGTIVLLALEILLGWCWVWAGLPRDTLLFDAFEAFIEAAAVEEFVKYGCARLALGKPEKLKKIDIVLIFGFAGMGYEIAETMMAGSPIAGALHGLFVSHIMYQFVMGHFFYEYLHAKEAGEPAKAKRNHVLAFAMPILLHGLNDFLVMTLERLTAGELNDASATVLIIEFLLLLAVNIFTLVWGLKLAKKDADAEVSLLKKDSV